MRRYQSRVFGMAFHYVRNREEALDLAQETFVRVYEKISGFSGHATFTSWLLLIARNLCIDHLRRRKARPPASDVPADEDLALASDAPGPEAEGIRSDREKLLYRALGKISEINREMIVLKDIQGLKLEEIATMLGLPLGTVKSRSARARMELARTLVDLEPSYSAR